MDDERVSLADFISVFALTLSLTHIHIVGVLLSSSKHDEFYFHFIAANNQRKAPI